LKIARVKHHGQTRYRVNDSQDPNVKRECLFFITRGDAVKTRKAEVAAFGVRFTTNSALRTRRNSLPSVAAAYNALAPEGRFKAHLGETAGNLTWQQETKPAAAYPNPSP
jgi:hypothetical protein